MKIIEVLKIIGEFNSREEHAVSERERNAPHVSFQRPEHLALLRPFRWPSVIDFQNFSNKTKRFPSNSFSGSHSRDHRSRESLRGLAHIRCAIRPGTSLETKTHQVSTRFHNALYDATCSVRSENVMVEGLSVD